MRGSVGSIYLTSKTSIRLSTRFKGALMISTQISIRRLSSDPGSPVPSKSRIF